MMSIRDQLLEDSDEDLIFITDERFDSAIIGLDYWEPRVVYDSSKIVEILAEDMPIDDAFEYFDYNIAGARGEGFPMFVICPDR